MIGHDDDGIDFERTRLANGSEGIARISTASSEARIGRRRSVTRVKKKVPPGTMARRYCMGNVGLRYANPTLDFIDVFLIGCFKERR